MLTFAIVLFIITYILFFVFPNHKPWISLGAALIFIIAGTIPLEEVFPAVDWNVILMLFGIMGTVTLFIDSKMPALIADFIIKRSKNVKWTIIFLAVFSGVVSAFIDNVATVVIIAPIAISICKKLDISPVAPVIAIALASNLEGAATLVGDTTAILLGGYLNMTFFDFFVYYGRPSMFFIVQGALIAFVVVLYILFRHQHQTIETNGYNEQTKVNSFVPTFLLLLTIITLIVVSFIQSDLYILNGLICVFWFFVGLVHIVIKERSFKKLWPSIKSIDYQTLLILVGLFIIITSIGNAGLIDAIGELFLLSADGNIFILYTLIVFVAVIVSAFIDNIPFVATMLPIIAMISTTLGLDPASSTVLYFGLLSGATLGGNFTPIGASANIAAIGILKKEGHNVSLKEYLSISVPTTLATVLTGYALIWLVFGV